MYAVSRVIRLFIMVRQEENISFLADSVRKYCQCSQCLGELQEEVELLQADWHLFFSIN